MTPRFTIQPPARTSLLAGLAAMLILAACAGVPRITGRIVPMPAGPAAARDATQAAQPPVVAQDTIYYVTDRKVKPSASGGTRYGYERSASMAFGRSVVTIGTRTAKFHVQEDVRFPETPVPFSVRGRRVIPDPVAQKVYDARSDAFRAQIAAALRAAGTTAVTLFIHGVRNEFEEAMLTADTLWRASGRESVPVAYSWPGDSRGLFFYFKDTEGGEFSVFHLKETLRLLAGVRGVRSINIVAHSRGTSVVTTALREMIIAARASGRDPRRVLKVDNLILAAPDLDVGIVRQRLMAEHFGPAFGRISVYMNPRDSTLALAQQVMSGTRFGRLTYASLNDNDRRIFSRIGNVDFINVANVVRGSGHSYFSRNPAVLADIGMLVRRSAAPDDPGRNLVHEEANFWTLVNPKRSKSVIGDRGGDDR